MKIILADDHDLVRDALATLIERDDPNGEVFRAENFDTTIELVRHHEKIDIVLLDVYMPGMNSLKSVKTMLNEFPESKIVLMSGYVQQSAISKGFEFGARGFVTKSMNGDALISVLKLVQSGVRYVLELFLDEEANRMSDNQGISKRETDVLVELSKGLSNKVIARNLGVEETTVKLHLRSLFKKLNVTNRTEAVIKARQLNFLG